MTAECRTCEGPGVVWGCAICHGAREGGCECPRRRRSDIEVPCPSCGGTGEAPWVAGVRDAVAECRVDAGEGNVPLTRGYAEGWLARDIRARGWRRPNGTWSDPGEDFANQFFTELGV